MRLLLRHDSQELLERLSSLTLVMKEEQIRRESLGGASWEGRPLDIQVNIVHRGKEWR